MSLNSNSVLFYGRHRIRLLNWQRSRWNSPPRSHRLSGARAKQETQTRASRAPADRGRGFVPPWTTTDGCRQAKCIISTGDPCLHHLGLFLELLHPPFFLFVSPSLLSVLSQVQTVADRAAFIITERGYGAVMLYVNYADEEQTQIAGLQRWTISGELRVSRFSFQTAGASTDQFLLSDSQPEVALIREIIWCNLWLEWK